MADRFPLIVNAVSQKIEELVSGDNLDLTGNNIVISGKMVMVNILPVMALQFSGEILVMYTSHKLRR